MELTAPKMVTFAIAVLLALLGMAGMLGVIAAVAAPAFWLMTAGFVVLVLGCAMKGL